MLDVDLWKDKINNLCFNYLEKINNDRAFLNIDTYELKVVFKINTKIMKQKPNL